MTVTTFKSGTNVPRGVDVESTGYVMLHIYIPRYMFRCFRGDCTTLPILLRDTYTTTCKGSLLHMVFIIDICLLTNVIVYVCQPRYTFPMCYVAYKATGPTGESLVHDLLLQS